MEPEMVNLIAELGTGATIIGVVAALLIRLDTKIDAVARDVVDVKVSVARIEGHLGARDVFVAARRGGADPETTATPSPADVR